MDAIIVGCSCYTSEFNRSINSKWAIFGLCRYCILHSLPVILTLSVGFPACSVVNTATLSLENKSKHVANNTTKFLLSVEWLKLLCDGNIFPFELYLMRLRWSRCSVLAFSTAVRQFKPGRSRRIFQGEKILSTPSFVREVKQFVPCRRFTAC